MKNRLFLYFVIALILTASILLYSCDKTSVGDIVSFDYPGTYKGTYKYIENWQQGPPDEQEFVDSVIFEFGGNGRFVMDMVDTLAAHHFCKIDTGAFTFSQGSLTISILKQNLDNDQCAPDHAPTGEFSYDVQAGYIVFTQTDILSQPFILKQIELLPYTTE